MTGGEILSATYNFRPVDHLYRAEFYIWQEALDLWKDQGLPDDWAQTNLFQYDPPGLFGTGCNLGWCEAPFIPAWEDKVVEDCGDYELVQDYAGRVLKVFKGRRHGFMPEYMKHPVWDMASWESVSERLDPYATGRFDSVEANALAARKAADECGGMVAQGVVGAYMYLRSLIGPEDLLYMVYDQPEVLHAAMQNWLELSDFGLANVQAYIELDQLGFGEDICYNHGLLMSPDMVREFLMPYYQQLVNNARARQQRRLFVMVDTDGDARPAIPLYYEMGMDVMSPFEVASGCDVVEIGRQYPDLVMYGGIDKRVLAAGKEAIEAHLQHIIPAMVERGGYYPTCDHGVPDNVKYEDYLYYRQRLCELDHK